MKRIISRGSVIGILVAIALLAYEYSSHRSAGPSIAFDDFAVDQVRNVKFSAREQALEDLSPRERLDQQRDWLLYTVVSASGLTNAEVNQALFDVPPIRHGYLQPVANF